MTAPAPQRQRVDAGASGLTTNELYARKHEIPDDINNAIPGVAMRIRQGGCAARVYAVFADARSYGARVESDIWQDRVFPCGLWAVRRLGVLFGPGIPDRRGSTSASLGNYPA